MAALLTRIFMHNQVQHEFKIQIHGIAMSFVSLKFIPQVCMGSDYKSSISFQLSFGCGNVSMYAIPAWSDLRAYIISANFASLG